MAYDREIKIRELLDCYFEGTTTLEEEAQLRDYFAGADIPADLLYAKAIFQGFSSKRADNCNFEVSFEKMHDNDAFLKDDLKPKSKIIKYRRLLSSISIAASVLIAVAITWIVVPKERQVVYCYVNGEPVTDIRTAERHALMVGRLIEGGVHVSEESQKVVDKAGRSVEQLGMAMRIIESISDGNNE